MRSLLDDLFALLAAFAPLVSRRVWRSGPVLVVGALVAPGRRMVSTALRTVGWGQTRRFQNSHRVLRRAVWSSRRASRILVYLLVATFVPDGPVVLGLDATIEPRRVAKIAAASISRDPVRSSRSHARQGERFALDRAHGARADPLRGPRVGAAVAERAGPLRALCAGARAGTNPSRSGPASSCARCTAGCRSARWSWWPTAPRPRSTGSRRCGRSRRWSPACVWMRRSSPPPRRVDRTRRGARAWSASGGPHLSSAPATPPPPGPR
jgi:hypothetical protein